jgi:3-hydroxyisobutyrate dehydrogenase
MTVTAKRVGFVGLGAMGMPMALNLVRAGHAVRAFDVSERARAGFAESGGEAGTSVAGAAEGAEVLAIMVATAAQAEAVLDEALPALPAGAAVLLHSTVAPAFAAALGERLAAAGHPFLDAPVSGGTVGAEAGKLNVMASGPEAAFEAAAPVLAAVAARTYRLGERPGVGSTVKLVNQLLAGVHIVAACEAMALGVRAGAEARTLFEVISNSAGNSWMFGNRVPHILERDFAPLSAVEIFVKDLGIVLDTGRELRFPLPVAATAHQQFLAAAAAGLGREDDSAVVKVYERLAGIEVGG